MWHGEIAAAKAALSDAATLGEQAGSQWIALGALEELASLQARAGELRQVLRTSEWAAQLSARMGGLLVPAAGVSHVGSAEVFYEWNDLARATQAASQGIDLLRGTVERLLLVRGYIVLAQIHQAHADHQAALEAIQRCEEWFAQTPILATDVALAWLAAYQARLWVWQGNLSAAGRWARECTFADDGELNAVQRLTLVWLRLAQSRNDTDRRILDEASATLARLLPAVEARGWTRYQVEIRALQALVCQAQADQASALNALERALILAETEGYIRIFVDAGAPMAALLAQSVERRAPHNPISVYVERLLSAFPGEQRAASARAATSSAVQRSPFGIQPLIEPLSARELEVLRLIAEGLSNQAIAERLIVAFSSVKRHIKNLYGKLGVQSRTQALLRARELGLL
jgi:LuxR family maltose regulon positive regulatory protein